MVVALSVLGALTACGESAPASPTAARCPAEGAAALPLTELAGCMYKGFEGGLYAGGGNAMPAPHLAAGLARARAIVPRATDGRPDPSGRIALLSIGMSNTTQEFCTGGTTLDPSRCDPGSFIAQAFADPAVNHTTLALVNGARGGRSAAFWTDPTKPDYDRVRDSVLAAQRLTEAQVQVVWLKVANPGPTTSLPASTSDAALLVTQMGQIVRALSVRYPNLQQVYVSSRIYAGYATSSLNPEPYAYESGFAVKWLVQAQIDQRAQGRVVDPRAGDLREGQGAQPWIAWGPYLWANGATPRTDGLSWLAADFAADGTHPADGGRRKVASALLEYFKTAPTASCWFLAGRAC